MNVLAQLAFKLTRDTTVGRKLATFGHSVRLIGNYEPFVRQRTNPDVSMLPGCVPEKKKRRSQSRLQRVASDAIELLAGWRWPCYPVVA